MSDLPITPLRYSRSKLIGITIVLILLFLIFFATVTPNVSITKTKKVTTLATVVGIERAVNGFYLEYSAVPNVGNSVRTDSGDGIKLLAVLLGLGETPVNSENKRGIKFLTFKEAKNRKNGLVMNSGENAPEGLFDPWGNPYTVILDTNYSNELHFMIAGKTVDLKERRVAAISPGPDGKLGTSDDVRNW